MRASQIVAALRANSADAPRELFDAYGEQLIAYCWQLLRSEDATLIAVRDTMIVAQAHADRLRDPGLLGPWLLALARTECGRRRTLAAGKTGKARSPVAAVAPVLAGTGATAAENATADQPPSAAWMRDEILTSIAEPEQARYRALAAARAPRLGSDGFPSAAAARILRRSRKHGRRVRGGLLTAGVAAAAAMILVAAGVSLRGGEWPAAPAASASPEATAPGGGPTREFASAPLVSHVTGAGLARQSLDPPTFSPAATGQEHQALYDVDSQTGASGHASPAGPSRRHWPNPSPGPDPGPTATFDSGGGQAQPGPGGARGTPRGHRHGWRGRR